MNQVFSKLLIFMAVVLLISSCNGKKSEHESDHRSNDERNSAHSVSINEHHKGEVAHRDISVDHQKHQSTHHIDSLSPALAFEKLISGNERYRQGNFKIGGANQTDREKLIAGQHPHSIILSCSDSRVPPEIIFDQKLGELFVVRTAGEALDNSSLASIEYAVEHLGVKLIVVMAHEYCGAVKAAFSTLEGGDAGSPSLNKLVEDIHPRIVSFTGKEPSNGFVSESKANASGVASDLLGRSEILMSKFNEKDLDIKTAIYHLNTGWVEFYSNPKNNKLKIEKVHRGLASVEGKVERKANVSHTKKNKH